MQKHTMLVQVNAFPLLIEQELDWVKEAFVGLELPVWGPIPTAGNQELVYMISVEKLLEVVADTNLTLYQYLRSQGIPYNASAQIQHLLHVGLKIDCCTIIKTT